MMTLTIRPNLDLLRRLPTIHQVAESWGRLELKLETDDTRYWLTTEGVAQKTSGTPINYVVNYVTVEKRTDDGNWDLRAVYSPDAWKLSQGFDYCRLLQEDLDKLESALAKRFSWDLIKEVEGVRRELDLTTRALFELAEKVRLGC
jgi:hypothetical protein